MLPKRRNKENSDDSLWQKLEHCQQRDVDGQRRKKKKNKKKRRRRSPKFNVNSFLTGEASFDISK